MPLLSLLRRGLGFGKAVLAGLPQDVEQRDPIALFDQWYAEARRLRLLEPGAMTLATATTDGRPSARMVLLKGHGADGFIFYTNYGSRKAAELDGNPQAALVLYWGALLRQVRIEGPVRRLDPQGSAAYFASRPRGSRIGAWASRQSEPLADRATLERRVRECTQRFRGGEVPVPPFWGGYRLVPETIEFWQGRADRLHDRVLFERRAPGWLGRRLYP